MTSPRSFASGLPPTMRRPSLWSPTTRSTGSFAASTVRGSPTTSTTELGPCSPPSRWKRSSEVPWLGPATMIIRKTPEQIEHMAASGAIQARCLRMLRSKCHPGVTTADLDEAAERFIAAQGAEASFKGYRGFPGSICASPNSMVVHGIPGSYELKRGDIVSLDVGVTKDGWVADAAITVPVGPINPRARELLDATKEALIAGAREVRPGNHLGDVSAAVQRHVESQGFSIIRSLVGHGIGRDMHEDPQIPNYGEPEIGRAHV